MRPIYFKGTFCPEYIADLKDRGFGVDHFRSVQRVLKEILAQDNDGNFHSKQGLMDKLSKAVPA